MKAMNKTGKIKAIILGLICLPNIIKPIGAQTNMSFLSILMPLIFGVVAIPLIMKINATIFRQVIERPTWNDKPIPFKKPLSFFHFGAFFFLTLGISMIIGTLIKYQQLNKFGLLTISFGIGILLGIQLLLKITKT